MDDLIVYTPKHRIPFQIDEDDYEMVSYFSWHIAHGYVVTTVPNPKGSKHRQRLLSMQIFLLGKAPEGCEWDHYNRNTYDNRRNNLRAVPHVVNKRNEHPNLANTTGVRGVSYNMKHGYFLVTIRVVNERKYIGVYYSLEEAKQARLVAEQKYWGNDR